MSSQQCYCSKAALASVRGSACEALQLQSVNRIRHLIWSAPPSSASSDIRMRGGAFVVWCKGPRKLSSGSPRAARFQLSFKLDL